MRADLWAVSEEQITLFWHSETMKNYSQIFIHSCRKIIIFKNGLKFVVKERLKTSVFQNNFKPFFRQKFIGLQKNRHDVYGGIRYILCGFVLQMCVIVKFFHYHSLFF